MVMMQHYKSRSNKKCCSMGRLLLLCCVIVSNWMLLLAAWERKRSSLSVIVQIMMATNDNIDNNSAAPAPARDILSSSKPARCVEWTKDSLPAPFSLLEVYEARGWIKCGESSLQGPRKFPQQLVYTLERLVSSKQQIKERMRALAKNNQAAAALLDHGFRKLILDDPRKHTNASVVVKENINTTGALKCGDLVRLSKNGSDAFSTRTLPPTALVTLGVWNAVHEDLLRVCLRHYEDQQQQQLVLHLRHAPRDRRKSTTKSMLFAKDGLSRLLQRHDPGCRNITAGTRCLLPATYRLSEETECRQFFRSRLGGAQNNSYDEQQWIIKATLGFRGAGIRLVRDVQKELVEPYGNCSSRRQTLTSDDEVVVQEYIPSYQIQNRNFYTKTWLLYKFGSAPNATTQPDPSQAWHIRVGGNHICSEESTAGHHPDKSRYAFICSRHMWKTNPRIENWMGGDGNVSYYNRYPDYWKSTLKEEDYANLLQRIDLLLGRVARMVDAYAREGQDYAPAGRPSWSLLGVDLVVDRNLQPWLIELNPCPGCNWYGARANDRQRNPFIPMWRVLLSHYHRTAPCYNSSCNDLFDEAQCSGEDDHLVRYF